MRMAWREKLARAGGLFEGEGCITLYSTPNARLALSMTDEDSVRRFAAAVGVGHVTAWHPPPHKNSGRQPQFKWYTGKFEHVQYVLAALWPFLGQRRRARAVAVLRAARR